MEARGHARRPADYRSNSKCKTESFTPPSETSREVKHRGRRLGASRLATPNSQFPRAGREAPSRGPAFGERALAAILDQPPSAISGNLLPFCAPFPPYI